MSKIRWDETGERLYETGVRNGVLYPIGSGASAGTYPAGVPWNGLSGVTESPSGAESTPIYADDIKYLNLVSAEDFGATIEAYSSPEEFDECDGTKALANGVTAGQQTRKTFGFSYRTEIGNDTDGQEHGYKLHLLYGCLASPSERSYVTINDSPEAMTLSWEITTTPVNINTDGYKPTSRITIDSTKATAANLKALEEILYGVDAANFDATKTYAVGDYVLHTDDTVTNTYKCKTAITEAGEWDATKWDLVANPGPRLPLPDEVLTIMSAT